MNMCYPAVMGRTLPTYTLMVFKAISELEPFYVALRRSDQLILDKFFEAVLNHRAELSNADSLLPIEMLPFVILLEERKKWDKLDAELLAEVKELENKVNRLFPP
jgi:hypothetical protein